MIDFTNEEKIQYFDEISKHFYDRNFGQTSKSEIDLLMFHFYIENLTNKCQLDDNVLDYNKCSDYKISKDLGITQQRISNLKVKNQLVYPIEFDWKKSLASLTKYAIYDHTTQYIMLNIPDQNLFLEIKNFIEVEKGGFVDIQLNRKIFKIRAEYYIELALELENDAKRKDVIKNLKKTLKNHNNSELNEHNIGNSIISALKAGGEYISGIGSIAALFSPTNALIKSLKLILKL